MKRPRNFLCKCGCGEYCTKNYKIGHILRIKPMKPFLGKEPPNKGMKIVRRETRICPICSTAFIVREKDGKKYCSRECSKKRKVWNKDLTKEVDIRVRDNGLKVGRSLKGKSPWNKNLTKEMSEGVRKYSRNRSEISFNLWRDKNFVNKVHSSWKQSPNNSEIILNSLIQDNIPDAWVFTGDGSFWITCYGKNMNPDFKSLTGKKVIELCGRFWHTEEEMTKRVKAYNDKGYDCLVIWEDTFFRNMDKTIEEIKAF